MSPLEAPSLGEEGRCHRGFEYQRKLFISPMCTISTIYHIYHLSILSDGFLHFLVPFRDTKKAGDPTVDGRFSAGRRVPDGEVNFSQHVIYPLFSDGTSVDETVRPAPFFNEKGGVKSVKIPGVVRLEMAFVCFLRSLMDSFAFQDLLPRRFCSSKPKHAVTQLCREVTAIEYDEESLEPAACGKVNQRCVQCHCHQGGR